jgi:hypothetical protein
MEILFFRLPGSFVAESSGETLFQADRDGVDSPAVTFYGDSVVNSGQERRGAIEATCP